MDEATASAQAALQQTAAGAAAALVQACSTAACAVPSVAAASLREELFPAPCCYLALAVSDGCALLLSANMLAPADSRTPEQAAVHQMSHCWAAAAIAARRPTACSLSHGSRRVSVSTHVAQHSDLAAAVKRWGASSFLCLPFNVPPGDAAAASSSSSSSNPGSGTAALLLGVDAVAAACVVQQQRRRQQQKAHVRSLISLAAAVIQHAAPELRQAAEALALLRPHMAALAALQPALLEGVQEEELEGWEEEQAEGEGPPAQPSMVAAAAGEPDNARTALAVEPAEAAAEELASSSHRAGSPAPQQCDQTAGTSQQAASATTAGVRLQPDGTHMASGSGAGPSSTLGQPGSSGAGPSSSDRIDSSRGAHPRLPEERAQPPQSTTQQPPAGRRLACLARVQQVLLLCWLSLREFLALPASRRSLGMDVLLRFRGPAVPAAVAFHGQDWGLLGHVQGRSLEDEFAEYHARILSDKVDAAASLLLLGVLILLCKEPASQLRIGHPLPTVVAALLGLPVLALLPGALRSWYVRNRERLLLLFFLVALTYQQTTLNFVASHFARTANARYINAGFQWITVDGLLLQMRFCHQLPTLLTCLLFNLGVIPHFCRRYHDHLEPRYCAAVAAWRGLLCLLAPLLIIYVLELRVRRGWLLQRQEREQQEERQREQVRAEQLERRRRVRGEAAGAWGSTR